MLRRRRAQLTLVAGLAVAASSSILLSACSSPSTGSVSGRMFFSGGPPSLRPGEALPLSYFKTLRVPAERAMPGTVTFTGSSGSFVVATARSGWFSAQLPVGSYTAVGHSSLFQDGTLPCHGVQIIGLSSRARLRIGVHGAAHLAVSCDGR